jgi:BirA family biotin operon repressor/biotin-[acetyl-CoA-carboxylase] ligase
LAIEQAACTNRDPLLRALLRALDSELRQWGEHEGDPVASGLREAYQQRCATLGEQVRVELPGQPVLMGTATDVDAEGRLVVLSEGQPQALSVGDVTHVRVATSGAEPVPPSGVAPARRASRTRRPQWTARQGSRWVQG